LTKMFEPGFSTPRPVLAASPANSSVSPSLAATAEAVRRPANPRTPRQSQLPVPDESELIRSPEIVGLIEKEVEMSTADLSQYKKIKAILSLSRELTVEGGELMPTLKVKRRVVVEKNQKQIDQPHALKESNYNQN